MPFIDYLIHNYCKRCEYRYDKEKGRHCPMCGYRARTAPRVAALAKEEYRN